MKKILTLLVMFLATANIMLAQNTTATTQAQTPKLTYQIVVRDADNNLVINQDLMARVTILVKQGADYTESAYANREVTGKTNMNGMLTLSLEDAELANIDMKDAKVHISISAYNIEKEMPIYAVPYALLAADNENALTTAEIARYLKNVPLEEFEQVIQAYWDNAATPQNISDYMLDTVVEYIKANVGAVRDLTFYYFQKLDEENVQEAYDAVSDEVKDAIAHKLGNLAKNHKDAAVEVAVYYLSNVTESDINGVLNILNENEAVKEIMAAAVDSVVDYIVNHQDEMISIAKKVVDSYELTSAQMEAIWDTVKKNEPVFDAMKDILNSCIYAYLDTTYRAVSDSACHPVDICALRDQIMWLRGQRHTSCPELTSVVLNDDQDQITINSTTSSFTMSATFFNNTEDVDLEYPGVEYKFILTYPGTKYAPVTLYGTYDNTSKTYSYTVTGNELNDLFLGRRVAVTAEVTGLRCKALTVSNDVPAFVKSEVYECPTFASFDHTNPNSADALGHYQGVVMKAELNSNYGTIDDHGFVIVKEDGQSDTLRNSTINGLGFADKLDMSYCGQSLTVYAFVKCGETSINSATSSFTLRGVTLDITASADSWKVGDDAVVLTAVNAFPISTQTFIDALGTSTPTVEQIIAYANAHPDLYGQYLGYLTDLQYTWEFPTVGTHTQGASENIQNVTLEGADAGDHVPFTATFTVTLFGSECSVSKTIEIVRDND